MEGSDNRDPRNVPRKRRVLLVEDHADVRDALTILLDAEGFEVAAAATGREALHMSEQREFDLLLTDLGLPDIPGDVLIRTIRSTARRALPAIVITAYGEPQTSRALSAGAQTVLNKPLDWDVFRDHVRYALDMPGLTGTLKAA